MAHMLNRSKLAASIQTDPLAIHSIDYVEFWVGNAYQAAHFYRSLFGFDIVAMAGPETGVRDRASYVLRQGTITLVFTAPLEPEGPIADHVALHGDGVKDIALRVTDVDAAYTEAVRRGGISLTQPETLESPEGTVRRATIGSYGDTVHSLVERDEFHGDFLPGYQRATAPHGDSCGLRAIDHVVGNVELGHMNDWVAYYRDVFGFTQLVHFSDEQISTRYTALMSKVMQDRRSRVKFPINEPAPGKAKSQIQEYLDYYRGPGVQHIALRTNHIVATVRSLQARGVRFIQVPDSYYDDLAQRIGPIQEDLGAIRELGILVDRDEHGYLLQTFTAPMQDRPTLFFEIIQRRGARGFGAGNFKALFEAIEREQARRGNL
jgi:4-hydroxyphenylpyruvate dioxygenase